MDANRHLLMMETLFGKPHRFGPASYGRLIRATLHGRVNGIPIENRLWFWCYALAQASINLICLIVGIPFGIFTALSLKALTRKAPTLHVLDSGIELHAKHPNQVTHHAWSTIRELRSVYDPPLIYWELILQNGEHIPLPMVETDSPGIAAHGVPVIDESGLFRAAAARQIAGPTVMQHLSDPHHPSPTAFLWHCIAPRYFPCNNERCQLRLARACA